MKESQKILNTIQEADTSPDIVLQIDPPDGRCRESCGISRVPFHFALSVLLRAERQLVLLVYNRKLGYCTVYFVNISFEH